MAYLPFNKDEDVNVSAQVVVDNVEELFSHPETKLVEALEREDADRLHAIRVALLRCVQEKFPETQDKLIINRRKLEYVISDINSAGYSLKHNVVSKKLPLCFRTANDATIGKIGTPTPSEHNDDDDDNADDDNADDSFSSLSISDDEEIQEIPEVPEVPETDTNVLPSENGIAYKCILAQNNELRTRVEFLEDQLATLIPGIQAHVCHLQARLSRMSIENSHLKDAIYTCRHARLIMGSESDDEEEDPQNETHPKDLEVHSQNSEKEEDGNKDENDTQNRDSKANCNCHGPGTDSVSDSVKRKELLVSQKAVNMDKPKAAEKATAIKNNKENNLTATETVDIYVGNINPTCTTDELSEYLRKRVGVRGEIDVRTLTKNENFLSFKVRMPAGAKDRTLNMRNWPPCNDPARKLNVRLFREQNRVQNRVYSTANSFNNLIRQPTADGYNNQRSSFQEHPQMSHQHYPRLPTTETRTNQPPPFPTVTTSSQAYPPLQHPHYTQNRPHDLSTKSDNFTKTQYFHNTQPYAPQQPREMSNTTHPQQQPWPQSFPSYQQAAA